MLNRVGTILDFRSICRCARGAISSVLRRTATIATATLAICAARFVLQTRGADAVPTALNANQAPTAPPLTIASKLPSVTGVKLEAKAVSKPIDFHRDIKPIFVRHCFACHGPSQAESGLRLDVRNRASKVVTADRRLSNATAQAAV
jgi:hypothetical protein